MKAFRMKEVEYDSQNSLTSLITHSSHNIKNSGD